MRCAWGGGGGVCGAAVTERGGCRNSSPGDPVFGATFAGGAAVTERCGSPRRNSIPGDDAFGAGVTLVGGVVTGARGVSVRICVCGVADPTLRGGTLTVAGGDEMTLDSVC
jgi:hypothetical protein